MGRFWCYFWNNFLAIFWILLILFDAFWRGPGFASYVVMISKETFLSRHQLQIFYGHERTLLLFGLEELHTDELTRWAERPTQRCNWVGARLPLTFNAVYIQVTMVTFHEIIRLNASVSQLLSVGNTLIQACGKHAGQEACYIVVHIDPHYSWH